MMTAKAPTTEQLRAAWDRLAPGYDEFVTPVTSAIAHRVLGTLGIRESQRLLDVAAGTGALAVPAARLGATVIAVDFAPTMIDRLAMRSSAAGLSNLAGRVMDGHTLEYADDSVDVAASVDGVSMFGRPRDGLAEMVRVTRPGGQVALAVCGAPPTAEWVRFFQGALRVAVPGVAQSADVYADGIGDPDQLRRTLSEAGLITVRVTTTALRTRFRSALHLWDVVTFSHPNWAQLTLTLTDRQVAEAQQVLDGMLRERSGGHRGAVLRAEVAVAVGTK